MIIISQYRSKNQKYRSIEMNDDWSNLSLKHNPISYFSLFNKRHRQIIIYLHPKYLTKMHTSCSNKNSAKDKTFVRRLNNYFEFVSSVGGSIKLIFSEWQNLDGCCRHHNNNQYFHRTDLFKISVCLTLLYKLKQIYILSILPQLREFFFQRSLCEPSIMST